MHPEGWNYCATYFLYVKGFEGLPNPFQQSLYHSKVPPTMHNMTSHSSALPTTTGLFFSLSFRERHPSRRYSFYCGFDLRFPMTGDAEHIIVRLWATWISSQGNNHLDHLPMFMVVSLHHLVGVVRAFLSSGCWTLTTRMISQCFLPFCGIPCFPFDSVFQCRQTFILMKAIHRFYICYHVRPVTGCGWGTG